MTPQEWARANRAMLNERKREERKVNPEKARAKGRRDALAWRLAHPGLWRERNQANHRKRMERDPDGVRAAKRKWSQARIHGPEYDALLIQQEGRCAVCRREAPVDRRMHWDHDHATGQKRGILCTRCNMALGLCGDSSMRLRELADYLERYS